jgi:hypothetical protein
MEKDSKRFPKSGGWGYALFNYEAASDKFTADAKSPSDCLLGHYRLEAEAKGFKKYVQEGISLDVNQTATVVVRLAVGIPTEEVRVQADAALIETTITSLGKTVGERDVLDLPLNGRNFSQLGLLQPGVFPLTPGLAQAGGSLRSGQAYAVNGQRPESNNFLIDGANNFNAVDGGLVIQLPIDSIAEFHILTHTASAEFVRSSGSTTNIVTRSGTNAFHGAAWEFLRKCEALFLRTSRLRVTSEFLLGTQPIFDVVAILPAT